MNKTFITLIQMLTVFFASLAGPPTQAAFEHYTVHRATDSQGKPLDRAPTLFLGHGCGGIVKHHIAEYVRDFTNSGYNVIVIDSLTPRNIKSACKNLAPNFKPRDRMTEFFEVLNKVAKEPWHSGKAGYVGFSHGGALGLNLAAEGKGFEAVVSYYPNCNKAVAPNRTLKIKTLIHQGTADFWTPLQNCDDIQGITERLIHKDATHAFDIKSKRREFMGEVLEYNEQADQLARVATKKFLDEALK